MLEYGFSEGWARLAAPYAGFEAGRVVSQSKNRYRVAREGGEVAAEVSGKLRFEARRAPDFPAVGDFVMLEDAGGGCAIIHQILPRKSAFIRKAAGKAGGEQVVAANIDTVFLCMALNNDFNLRRLERYLAIGWDSGAVAVVVLTKADLCPDLQEKLSAVRGVAIGADVRVTSAAAQDGCAQIAPYLGAGQTVAFIGSSGVGKSTLINRLLGVRALKTGGLRNDDRGRHTTTRRELLPLPGGGMVIDTPGMRELGMGELSDGLDKSFSDVEALFSQCRFKDCGHSGEPGCAVEAAIARGDLPQERWLSYQKLRREARFAQDRSDCLARKERLFKDIARMNRSNAKK